MYESSIIGVWGYGVVGKAAVEFFKGTCRKIIIFDQQPQAIEHSDQLEFLEHHNDNDQVFLSLVDYCIISPGIKTLIPDCYKHKIINELDIFARTLPADIMTLGITGSVGKTSITALLYSLINHLSSAWVGGNIGIPLLNATIPPQTRYAVLELSSFQLENIQSFAPKLAIITNLYANHLDRHGSQEAYGKAKANIFAFNTETLIISSQAAHHPAIKKILLTYKGKTIIIGSEKQEVNYTTMWYIKNGNIIKQSDKKMVYGKLDDLPALSFKHNWLFVIAALDSLGLSFPWEWTRNHAHTLLDIKTENMLIECGSHRLEKIEKNGYIFYNDSKSTLIESTIAALEALAPCSVVLLLGGISKGAQRTKSMRTLYKKVKHIICFGKEANELHQACIQEQIPSSSTKTLQEAFCCALEYADTTDIILLSPGGASFDLFSNYQERGNKFKELIYKLRKERNDI